MKNKVYIFCKVIIVMAAITLLIISANNSKVHAKNGPCTKKSHLS